MTLRVNSSFATTLNAAKTSNVNWSNAFKTGLGATRRVKCVRHASDATAEDQVFALGTVFRDAALTGEMTINAGVITYYGATSGLTTALAADLATGKSVLRIEGNGNWIEGTLGLVGSDCDFVLPVNPTTTNSIAVAANMRIKPPPFLPSGTGPAPPTLDANAPAFVIIENWTNPAAVVEAGRIPFNNRIENMVFEDSAVAAEMGDVRITQSTDSVTLGEFIFGATMFSMNPVVNSVAGQTLNQVLIGCRPTEANWPRYPRSGGYRKGSRIIDATEHEYGLTNTFPPPFKAKICKADGTVLYTHEMRDGLPINSPECKDVASKTYAIRPHFHCGSMLPWESHKPKLSAKANHYFPGLHSTALRHSLGKERDAFNAPYILYRPAQPGNSSGHWYAMPKWALPISVEAFTADQANRTDPYLFNIGPSSPVNSPYNTRDWMKIFWNVSDADAGSLTYGQAAYQGWGYEPGTVGCHDQYTGPGGPRIDRSAIPGPIAIHMTNPTWVHLRDNTPIVEMVEHWNRNYFNNAWHYLTDAKTFDSLPLSEVLAGTWGAGDTYYGGLDTYVPGGVEYTVPFFAYGNGTGERGTLPHAGAFVDTNYRMPWNGAAIDSLHNYQAPGWVALLYNSPMHAYSQKLRYFTSIMCQLGNGAASTAINSNWYATRRQAWTMFQAAMTWKLSANHTLGIPQADIEQRIVDELTAVYDQITLPMNVQNSQEVYFKMLRNFGIPVRYYAGAWICDSMGLTFYMAHALQFWRQSGLWRKMYDHSIITREALLTIIQTLDVACFGFILETDAGYIGSGGSLFNGKPTFMAGDTNTSATPDVPTGWTDWQNRVYPKLGAEDMIHAVDGSLARPDLGEQLRMQWPEIRRDYFPDVPCVYDVAAACTKVAGWHTTWANHVATQEAISPRAAALAEWKLPPGYGRILPPTTLEP